MSGIDDLRAWADGDRTQAEVIRWLVAVGDGGPAGDLSTAQAASLDATAEGWGAIADEAEQAAPSS